MEGRIEESRANAFGKECRARLLAAALDPSTSLRVTRTSFSGQQLVRFDDSIVSGIGN